MADAEATAKFIVKLIGILIQAVFIYGVLWFFGFVEAWPTSTAFEKTVVTFLIFIFMELKFKD